MKYGAWEIREGMASLGDVCIPVNQSVLDVHMEGMYGALTSTHVIAVAGVCLFDTSWCVRFTTGGTRSIALPLDRQRVEERIRSRGFIVNEVIFPTELTAYHRKLIGFVANTITQIQPEKLLFHIPHEEYKIYIRNLEELIGKDIPGSEEILSQFVEKVRTFFCKEMIRIGFTNYEFISPMHMGAKTTEDSYVFPYLYPEVFGACVENLFAIEDLVEVKITILAEEIKGHRIPVRFCILDDPHPYMTFSKKIATYRQDLRRVALSF
jgi:hypothetical protein